MDRLVRSTTFSRVGLVALASLGLLCVALWPQSSRGDTLLPGGTDGRIVFASDRAFAVPDRSTADVQDETRSAACNDGGGGIILLGENGSTGDDSCAFEIYTMNPDGSGVTRLTDNVWLDDEPSWSPDGTKIAFVSRRDCVEDAGETEGATARGVREDACTADLWVMNADGSNPIQLTDACDPGEEEPEWDVRGVQVAPVTCRSGGLNDSHPSWSPDGTTIAFSRGGIRDGSPTASMIFTISATGGTPTLIDTGTGGEGALFTSDALPYWSPDGASILFTRLELQFLGNGESEVALEVEDALAQIQSATEQGDVGAAGVGGFPFAFFVHTFTVPAGGVAEGQDADAVGEPAICSFGARMDLRAQGIDAGDCSLELNPALSPGGDRLAIQRVLFRFFGWSPESDSDTVTSTRDGSDQTVLEAGDPGDCGVFVPNGEVGPLEVPVARCFGDFKPAYSPTGSRIVFHSDRIDEESWACPPYVQTLAYGFELFGSGDSCETAIYTIATDGTSISGPLGRDQLVSASGVGSERAALAEGGPIVDRNADWQRVAPSQQQSQQPGFTPQSIPEADACASDNTGPRLRVRSLQGKTLYRKGEPASVRIRASDPLGLRVDPSRRSRRISTDRTGQRRLRVRAVDRCGNVTRRTFAYAVAPDPVLRVLGMTLRSCTFGEFPVQVNVAGVERVRRVGVRLDGRLLRSTRRTRFTIRIDARELRPGPHVVRIAVRTRAGALRVARQAFRRCAPIDPFFTG